MDEAAPLIRWEWAIMFAIVIGLAVRELISVRRSRRDRDDRY